MEPPVWEGEAVGRVWAGLSLLLGCPDYSWATHNSPVWATTLQPSWTGGTLVARAAVGWSDCASQVGRAREGNEIAHWSLLPALGSRVPLSLEARLWDKDSKELCLHPGAAPPHPNFLLRSMPL